MEDVIERTEEPSADELADFEAGFNGVRGDEPPASDEPHEASTTDDGDTEAAHVEPEAPVEDIIIPGLDMPASQVRQLLAKAAAYDDLKSEIEAREAKVFGKFGDVQRHLNQIKELQDQVTALKESGNRAGSLKLSAQKDKLLARVRAEYPELGELLAEDIAELSGDSAQEMPDVGGIVDQKMSELNERIEMVRLETAHPDWQEVSSSTEFALWKSGLNPEVRQQLETSNDSRFVSRGLSAFKEWRDKSRGKSVSTQQRLSNAVTPSGTPSATVPSKSEEQEFEEGFKAIRSRRL